jgi:membrane associated rhomboid family serine protease
MPQGAGFYGYGCSFSLGASGAIFGLFGAMIILFKRLGANRDSVVTIVAVNLVICFFMPNVAWQAHVGGLIAGISGITLLLRFGKNRAVGFY